MESRVWNYDRSELLADGAVHIAGMAFSILGASVLVAAAFWLTDLNTALATLVYALTLVAALFISALYSMWPVGPVKWRLRKFDHAAIYLLIAGTYTPFTLMMGRTGLWLLAWVWLVAAAGIVLKLAFPDRFDRLSAVFYLGLAWSGAIIFGPLLERLPMEIIWLLIVGGIIYSAGVPFHLWKKLRFHKAIWHGFVLTGAMCHYCAVYLSVVGVGS